MNNVNLVGRLTKDPQLSQSKQGQNYVRYTVAVDQYTSKEKTAEFIPCISFGKTAEFLTKYASKGSYVSVEGTLRSSWREKQTIKYLDTIVVGSKINLLTNWKNTTATGPINTYKPTKNQQQTTQESIDTEVYDLAYDDLPF